MAEQCFVPNEPPWARSRCRIRLLRRADSTRRGEFSHNQHRLSGAIHSRLGMIKSAAASANEQLGYSSHGSPGPFARLPKK
jgi:hypothetical protein